MTSGRRIFFGSLSYEISKMDTSEYRINLCKAIQSLDSLNDQIVQYIFSQSHVDIDLEKDLSPREQETLQSSMVLIRRLLVDAQAKFRKMVEDNKQLAARIDGSIQAANQEVNALRAELADTNKRLSEISVNDDKNENDSESDLKIEIIPSNKSQEDLELVKVKEDNMCLENEVKSLKKELEELRSNKKPTNNVHHSNGELKLELIQMKQEFNRAKEALQAMKADRKRLKGEKLELLKQIKQLYDTLEEKESELRDFIRNYEQRVQESDDTIKQLVLEKEESEREKWEIIKKARESAERVVLLRAQLDSKDQQIKQLEADIVEIKESTVASVNKSVNLSDTTTTLDSITVATNITNDDLPPYESPPPSTNKNFTVSTSTPNTDRKDSLTPLMKWFNTSHDYHEADVKNKKKRKSFGSLSRVFTRGRTRRSIAMTNNESLDPEDSGPCPKLTLLSQENYQEKLQILEQVKGVHMSNWKANHVLAWLETSLSMPMYGKMCAENIKSGKVLLGLSDSELNNALNVVNILHRRKLRLAIDEQRDPVEVKFPKADSVDHTWVSHRWLPDLGLPQYTAIFESHLVDGRTLNTLNKKDLEKYFDMHRKCHQASILHGVELLRRLGYDREVLAERRTACEEAAADPLVWSNKRIISWIKSIDLGEYADNLKESGIHGALMVLEPSFTSDTLATALGIPPAKSFIRRHLNTELDSLIKPARAALDTPNNNSKKSDNGSANKSFNRSFRSSSTSDDASRGRLSFRGSLSRAFGKKFKDDLKLAFDDTPKRKISSPIQIQHNSLDSVAEPDSTPV
ncbi:kazrin isoform X2 [Patella vulgata]|uniref:kazrin isoform X2 n=1 Tax=Patella vulgata TaxID=6465 RepID=UPI0024A92858|nr:kazrin isoform X2 [Patella vulgata]